MVPALGALARRHDEGVEGERGRVGDVERQPLGDQVPVVVEGGRDLLEVVELDAERHREEQHPFDARLAEQPLAERRPALLEGDLRLDLVHHLDGRRQARFDRVLAQQALGEGVEGADGGGVGGVEGPPAAFPDDVVGTGGGPALELDPHPVAQLGGGFLGERDGGHGGEVLARLDEGDDPPHQLGGLA